MRVDDLRAKHAEELEHADFLLWLMRHGHSSMKPDAEDYDKSVSLQTNDEAADKYRSAQARKMLRLYQFWKTAHN